MNVKPLNKQCYSNFSESLVILDSLVSIPTLDYNTKVVYKA